MAKSAKRLVFANRALDLHGARMMKTDKTQSPAKLPSEAGTTTAERQPEMAQETAILNCRVRRQPASLGNYHYHVEAGKRVFVTYRYPNGERVQVSTVEEKHRCSEDLFTVPASFLTFD